MAPTIFQFGPYLLDSNEQRFQKNGRDIDLPPKVFAVLSMLLSKHGQLVTADELHETVWKDTFVEDGNIRYCIHSLRKALDGNYIETVPKRGYRFTADVTGYTAEEFIDKHLKQLDADTPDPVRRHRLSWPIALAAVAIAALIGILAYSKYGSIEGAVKEPGEISIAVMPFEIIGADATRQQTIQNALLEALEFKLGKIRGISITRINTRETDEVVTGTYRLDQDSARVHFQILDAKDSGVIAAQTFVVTEPSQIEIETSIVLRIAGVVHSRASALDQERKIADSPLSEEFERNYLTARSIINRNDYKRFEEASGLTRSITSEYPDWAPGWIAYSTVLSRVHGSDACGQAEFAFEKALELEPAAAEVFVGKALCFYRSYDWKQSETAFLRAIELDPDFALAYIEYGSMLDFQRRFAEAENQIKKGIELSPYNPDFHAAACLHYYYDTKPVEALNHCRDARRIVPNFWLVPKMEYWIYVYQNRWEKMLEISYGNDPAKIANVPSAKALSEGRIADYWKLELEARLVPQERPPSDGALATLYVKNGKIDQALEHLERAVENPRGEPFRLYPDPITEPLWKEPRFIAAMKKMGLGYDPSESK